MHKITAATPDELQLEIDLGKNAQGEPTYAHEDAGTLMLIYTDCARAGGTMEQSYEAFRQQLSLRWKTEINFATAYLVVETIVKITQDLKKKHISGSS